MKISKKSMLVSLFVVAFFSFLLIPRIKAQEWTYDGANTEKIPNSSVYPSEWYIFEVDMMPPDIRAIFNITHGNVSNPMMWGDGTCIWGDMIMWNTTSGEKIKFPMYEGLYFSYWNGTGYEAQTTANIIPVENDGKVSVQILNNVKDWWSEMLSYEKFEHNQTYHSIYSIAFWNESNNGYLNINYTDDGILTKWESYNTPMGNLTLYSQPAQLPPVFSFTTELGTLTVKSTEIKLNISVTDADNNNDGEIDNDYLFRILNGSTWTDWASIPSLLDWDLGDVPAGNYNVTIEVKNMYGVTQEEITIQYKPDVFIPGYSTLLVVMTLIFCVSIIMHKYMKKLRT
ncbi:MAG: hypothetical protein ACFFDN_31900 [Candidatus Hodarchaeota archaeon]